jgi:TolA-binding protein
MTTELVAVISALVVSLTSLAAAATAWLRSRTSVSKTEHNSATESHIERIKVLETKLDSSEKASAELSRRLDQLRQDYTGEDQRLNKRCQDIENESRTYVTSEEFQTYTASVNSSINGLTEKVGRATGILETFRQR